MKDETSVLPMLFDSHVNLHGETYQDDLYEVMQRARDVGVTRFVAICDRLDNFEEVRAIAHNEDGMWCTAGVHPHYAKDFPSLNAKELIEICKDPIVVGVGETGLDLHYGYSPLEDQVRAFREHIAASRDTGLPLIVHSREADDLMGDILEEEMAKGEFQPLMHCYTSGPELARRAANLGAYFSVSGIMTFKKAQDVRDIAQEMPLDRVILETDCPYLAPVPHRGRRNEPSYLPDICKAFAELRGLDVAEMADLTTNNCLRLFGRTS